MSRLTPAKLKSARRSFFIFNGFNASSFVLLSGSMITLFALRLGASNVIIGVLNAFAYGTFLFLPLGKLLASNQPLIRIFGVAWLLRYLAMVPILLSPVFVAMGSPPIALILILVGVAAFNIFRGIGLIGNNPVLANLADGGIGFHRSDRGSFLVNVQITGSLAALTTNLAVAATIGKTAQVLSFVIAIGIGIIFGIICSYILLKQIPEPEDYHPQSSRKLLTTIKEAMMHLSFRRFILILFILSFSAGMARTFLPVYARTVFSQGDNAVMLYSFIANTGALIMGLLSRLLVDRLGPRPLFVIYSGVAALSLLPLALVPVHFQDFVGTTGIFLFLASVNFISAFGLSGEENSGQAYFFSMVKPERTMDLGVIYFLAYGLGGTLGAGMGGVILDLLEHIGASKVDAYRIFFGFLLLLIIIAIVSMGRLLRFGSASVRESIGVMLSIKDLRSFNLLKRLDQSADPSEEIEIIHKLGGRTIRRPPTRAQESLLLYLGSPRFDIRMEALHTIEAIGNLHASTIKALLEEVEKQPFTTAYIAARILGKSCGKFFYEDNHNYNKKPILISEQQQRRELILPTLRKAAINEDYLLKAAALIGLARLQDKESLGLIIEALVTSRIPRVRISAAYALEIMKSKESLAHLIACLRSEKDPAYVSDELLLSAATILDMMPQFYNLYASFLDNETTGFDVLEDIANKHFGKSDYKKSFTDAFHTLFGPAGDGAPISRFILSTQDGKEESIILAEAALDKGLSYIGLKYFIVAFAVLKFKTT